MTGVRILFLFFFLLMFNAFLATSPTNEQVFWMLAACCWFLLFGVSLKW